MYLSKPVWGVIVLVVGIGLAFSTHASGLSRGINAGPSGGPGEMFGDLLLCCGLLWLVFRGGGK